MANKIQTHMTGNIFIQAKVEFLFLFNPKMDYVIHSSSI